MAKQPYYPPTGNSILPPSSRHNLSYAQRSVPQNHINNVGSYTQTWVLTGMFADSSKQTQQGLSKISTCYIDYDLTDTLVYEGYAQTAKRLLLQNGVTSIYKNSAAIDINSIDIDTYAVDLVKACISYMPVDTLQELVREKFTPILERQFIPFIGKPSLITYTGHGAHAYYWLNDNEGYTDVGLVHAPTGVANADAYKRYFKGLYAQCNTALGYQAVDPKVSDLGTRCTRELGSVNSKNSANPKVVSRFMLEHTEGGRRVALADFAPLNTTQDTIESIAAAGRGRGRPPKFKPINVQHDEDVFVEVNGQVHTMTVAEFSAKFDDLMAQQNQQNKVRNVRLAQLGQGSMNMFATRSGDGVMFILTASKYMERGDRHWKEDASGNWNGFYLFDGMTFELSRTDRGTVRKNSSNLQQILTHDAQTAGLLQYNSRLEQVFIHRDLHLDVYGAVNREVRIARATEWFKFKDAHYITFEKVFNQYGLDNVPDSQISRVVRSVAMQRAFDPVTDWIESIQWDGKRRLDGADSWLCTLLNLPADHPKRELYATYGRCVMLGILRNIYVGDTYPDVQHVLTLAGGQGVGKSLAAAVLGLTEVLGMDYFHDSGIDMGAGAHKGDQIASMLGCFLVELPEAISLSSNSTDASIKAFLTTKKDKGRFAFGREHEERLRATYFVTNSNDNIFLSDHTGNRRYLVVDCFDDLHTEDQRLDIDALRAVLPQLYAEAYQRGVLGQGIPDDRKAYVRQYEGLVCEQWNLSHEERDAQTAHNMKFTQPDYIVEELSGILADELARGVSCVSYAEVKRKLHTRDPAARLSNVKFANAMTRAGWRRATVEGKNVWMPLEVPQVSAPLAPPNDLQSAHKVINRADFRSECSVEELAKLLRMQSAAALNTQHAQKFIREVSCAVNAQILDRI